MYTNPTHFHDLLSLIYLCVAYVWDEEINRLKCLSEFFFQRFEGDACKLYIQWNWIHLIHKAHLWSAIVTAVRQLQRPLPTQTKPIFVCHFAYIYLYVCVHPFLVSCFLIKYQIMPSLLDCQNDVQFFFIYYHYVHLITRRTNHSLICCYGTNFLERNIIMMMTTAKIPSERKNDTNIFTVKQIH